MSETKKWEHWMWAEWSWVQTETGTVLHHMREADDPEHFAREAYGDGATSCGVRSALVTPGVFSRMGAPRCRRCCKALGFPPGDGSPKNDDALRPLVEARIAAMTHTLIPRDGGER